LLPLFCLCLQSELMAFPLELLVDDLFTKPHSPLLPPVHASSSTELRPIPKINVQPVQAPFSGHLGKLHELFLKRDKIKSELLAVSGELRVVENQLTGIDHQIAGRPVTPLPHSDDDSDTEDFRERDEAHQREQLRLDRDRLFLRKLSLQKENSRTRSLTSLRLDEVDGDIDGQLDVIIGQIENEIRAFGSSESLLPATTLFAQTALAILRAQSSPSHICEISSHLGDHHLEVKHKGDVVRAGFFGRALHYHGDQAASVVREAVGSCVLMGVRHATLFVSLDDSPNAASFALQKAVQSGITVDVVPLRRFKDMLRQLNTVPSS